MTRAQGFQSKAGSSSERREGGCAAWRDNEIEHIGRQIDGLGGLYGDGDLVLNPRAWKAAQHREWLKIAFLRNLNRSSSARTILGLVSFQNRGEPNEVWRCDPKIQTLANRIGRSRTQTCTSLQQLHHAGIIDIKKRNDGVLKEQRSSQYTFDRPLGQLMRSAALAGAGSWFSGKLAVFAYVLAKIDVRTGYARLKKSDLVHSGVRYLPNAVAALNSLLTGDDSPLVRVGDGLVTLRVLVDGKQLRKHPSEHFWEHEN